MSAGCLSSRRASRFASSSITPNGSGAQIDPVLRATRSSIRRPGTESRSRTDPLAVNGVDWRIVSAGGQVTGRRCLVGDNQTRIAAASRDSR
jgi:hypothetical protein